MRSKEIVVHSAGHARVALAAAAALHRPVTLTSAAGAAVQAGPGWFKAVIEDAHQRYPEVAVTAILDCSDEPGAAMAALRAGVMRLRFSGPAEVRLKLTEMGAVFAPPSESALDLLDIREPEAACAAFLGEN